MLEQIFRPSRPIGIHHSPGSYSDAWIDFCVSMGIPYRIIDCYRSDILKEASDCCAVMWHWSHSDAAAANFARQLTISLESMGVPVFPSTPTAWHFDDKLGQKYLFEALDIPHVPSFAFYSEDAAKSFVNQHGLPLVFKLASGAGSKNVQLVNRLSQAESLIERSFRLGWKSWNRLYALEERIWRFRRDKSTKALFDIGRGLIRTVVPHEKHRTPRLESGYVYFQEFIPGNDSDIRITVIGDKAVGFRRMTRKGDFRASGSGVIAYDPEQIPIECVEIAFESARKIGSQTAAFDFVFDGLSPLVVEVSYGFAAAACAKCPGYWDPSLNWHEAVIRPEEMILRTFLEGLSGQQGV